MTGGLGFTTLMKSILRTNKSFLRYPGRFKSKKDSMTWHSRQGSLKYNQISGEELSRLRTKLKKEHSRQKHKEDLVIIITILIAAALFLTVYLLLIP